jgi:hypothetical protein
LKKKEPSPLNKDNTTGWNTNANLPSTIINQKVYLLIYIEQLKQTLIPRKNYSLPKTLTSCHHEQQHQNIRNRKLIYSSQSKHNEHKASTKNIFLSSLDHEHHAKIDYSKHELFAKGL